LPGGARKSTLFVLKAQIEAQAAKLRRAGKKASAQQGSDTKRSDVEALKALLEARAAERAQARQSPGDKARGDASIRGSHIAALWALHDARAAAREAAARDEAIRAEADRSSYSDSSDDTDEPVAIEAVDDESDATEAWSPTLPERVWKALPADVQEVVREIAAGFVVDEAIKNRLAAALNRLIVSREFLNDAELEAELNAGQPATARKQWSEAELRSAARRALAKVLPGLAAARSPTAVRDVSRLVRGQCFGLAEVLTGRAHGATYIACPSLQGGPLPVELVRIDGGTLAKLRESSAEFQAACRQFSG
jgi:hypothetical protein